MKSIKERIYEQFYEKPEPIFILNDIILPAASLWSGIREWVRFFRSQNIQKGDRVLLSIPFGIEFLFVLYACIWEEITVFLLNSKNYREGLLEELDCVAEISTSTNPYSIQIENYLPIELPLGKRKLIHPSTTNILLFLQSTGTTGNPKWIGLSEKNILSVIDSHYPILEKSHKGILHSNFNSSFRSLSILPMTHAFGLIIDFFHSILFSELVVRDPDGGKNIEGLLRLAKNWEITHLSCVPLTMERILQAREGREFVKRLQGGIIGGAPISGSLAEKLSGTNLRVGYGLTEASPGLFLGAAGDFSPFYIGESTGFEWKISSEGELFFRGDNSFTAIWKGECIFQEENCWVPTGDIVRREGSKFYWIGRKDFSFKLKNGKMFFPEKEELFLKSKLDWMQECCFFLDIEENLVLLYESVLDNRESEIRKILPSFLANEIRIYKSLGPIPLNSKGSIDRSKIQIIR
jgi:acyl-CoA synthetase (AMP-forming)/AMP-acid ligase II